MKPFRIFLAIIFAFLWVSNLNADDVYFWTDEDGVVHMTNQVPQADKKVEKEYIPKLKRNPLKEPASRFKFDKAYFINNVKGQNQNGVARFLGEPDRTSTDYEGKEMWVYYNIVDDWKTGVESALITFWGKRKSGRIEFFK